MKAAGDRPWGRYLICGVSTAMVLLSIAGALWVPRAGKASGGATIQAANGTPYVVLAWNDLGMHCINPGFSHLAVLPPFNNLWVQVIRRGAEPQIVRRDIRVFYAFPDNKTTRGKSDFWKYDQQLFGVDLPEGVGLTGNGLSGEMRFVATPYPHYEATGIPILPISDNGKWNPYQ